MIKALESVIVKPTGAKCNLDCEYCFYLEKEELYPDLGVMKEETLHTLLWQLHKQSGKHYNITWQGGEPCLAGLDFYKKVVETQMRYGEKEAKIIGNSLQTNGTLLNNDWIDFLARYNFLVGLSIDGPKQLHDASRPYKNGNGSWKKAIENGRKLLKANVAVNILCCITSYNASYANKIYDFFKEEGFSWLQFNPVHEKDSEGNILDISVNAKRLGEFMCRIFDRWYNDFTNQQNAPIIRFIENAFHSHLNKPSPECSFQQNCGGYLLVEHNGDIYNCDFFVNPKNLVGNIGKDRLFDLLNSSKQKSFGNKKGELHNDCNQCPWLKMCYGGCSKYRDTANGKHVFCEAYKMFYSYSNSRLQQLAEIWKRNNPPIQNDTFDASGYFK